MFTLPPKSVTRLMSDTNTSLNWREHVISIPFTLIASGGDEDGDGGGGSIACGRVFGSVFTWGWPGLTSSTAAQTSSLAQTVSSTVMAVLDMVMESGDGGGESCGPQVLVMWVTNTTTIATPIHHPSTKRGRPLLRTANFLSTSAFSFQKEASHLEHNTRTDFIL